MKSFAFIYLLLMTGLLGGCQSFQFVDNPIPVKPVPTTLVTQ